MKNRDNVEMFDDILLAFFDIFINVKKSGMVSLTNYSVDFNESPLSSLLFSEGISLSIQGLTPEVFKICWEISYYKMIKLCDDENELKKIVFIFNCMPLVFRGDIEFLSQTQIFWSERVKSVWIEKVNVVLNS